MDERHLHKTEKPHLYHHLGCWKVRPPMRKSMGADLALSLAVVWAMNRSPTSSVDLLRRQAL